VDHFAAAADRIRIEQLELHARTGVTEEEPSKPQRIIVNLTIWPKMGFDQMKDDMGRTVNYVELCRSVREFIDQRTFSLIETLSRKSSKSPTEASIPLLDSSDELFFRR
jgi:dihydroneopterin aldolase